jgi:epoxyqueuosine reductase
MGSWLFLGEILLDIELDYTTRNTDVNCGSCRRCLDACPTGALIAPYVLDARRCISYLTIELKGPIPHDLRPLLGNWIYGCDICQIVCPWQRFAKPTRERLLHIQGTASPPSTVKGLDRISPLLSEFIRMNEETFQRRYIDTPLYRTGRHRLLRNAAVALGNQGSSATVPALTEALADEEPLVRGHAAWALGRIGGQAAQKALENALSMERDPYARREILAAIGALA